MGKIITSVFILLVLSQSTFGAENQPPSALVQAIITVESGGRPFAVHMGGTTYQPDTLEEASRLVMEAMKEGRNFDVGLMQVNSWWMKRFGISPESLLVPETNMAWGKAILRDEIVRHGLTWKAVGKYHSPDPELGRRYAWKVYWNYKSGPTAHEAKEINHAAGTENLSDPGGIQRRSGVRPQGRAVTFDVQQKCVLGNAGSEPGASGSPAGTAKD
jgi:soluble lytic murein transglycosylase-like protein